MNLDQAVSHIQGQLLEFCLAKLLNDDERDIKFDYIEPFTVKN